MPVKMRYADTQALTSAAGVNGTYVLRANGLFDPDQSSIGHQPRLFDQLMLFYDHYVVVGCKLRVTFSHAEAAPVMVGIYPRDTSTIDANNNNVLEYPGTKYAMTQATGGTSSRTLVYNFNPNKWLGRSRPMSDPHLKGSVSTNPAEEVYLHIFMFRQDGTPIGTGDITFQIDYAAVLVEPKIGNPS